MRTQNFSYSFFVFISQTIHVKKFLVAENKHVRFMRLESLMSSLPSQAYRGVEE